MANYNSSFTGPQIDAGITLANSAQQPPVEGPFVNGDKSKLDGVEPLADVTDATNVEAAGALMDSEVTNLAAVKSFDPTDYATSAQGALADTAVQPADLSTVATSGAYTDLTGLPTLGTAAATDSTAYATAAQGALADTAVQPAAIANFETTTELNSRDTANRDRANHTGTQAASTITGLATVATSGAYTDLTGLPTLGTAAATDSTAYATAAQGALADTAVQPADLTASISALVDSAPGTLDTLNELAAALGDDPNFATTITSSISTKLNASAVSSFGLTLIDDIDAATARGTLGLGTSATTDSTAYATSAQGALADTAVQPADLSTVATSGAYTDLTGLPTLGTAAATDSTAYATAAQGALADTAVQPAAIANFETTTELNSRDTANRDRANHTGTQAASTITGLAAVATSGSYNDLTDQPTFSSDLDGLTDVTLTSPVDGQVLEYDSATGKWINATTSGVPGGADTQIQFNDGGAFNGDTALTWNKTTDELTVGGDVILDDGVAGFETIVQCVPPTADRVISFPDTTGIVALTSDLTSFETTAQLDSRDTANRDRANHTGTQTASTISDFDSAASAAAPVQSSDIANFETTTELNSRDTANRDRANHTGTQTASTISDFSTAADARITASDKVSSDPTGVTGADQITNMMSLTQAEYDAITPDASTFYVIVG